MSNFKRDFRYARSHNIVDKTRKRSWVYIYTSLVSELQSLRSTLYDPGCLVASQKDVYLRIGIHRIETIKHEGLY